MNLLEEFFSLVFMLFFWCSLFLVCLSKICMSWAIGLKIVLSVVASLPLIAISGYAVVNDNLNHLFDEC